MEAFFDQASSWPFEPEGGSPDVDVGSTPRHTRNFPSDEPSPVDSDHGSYTLESEGHQNPGRTQSELSVSDEDTRTLDSQSDPERYALDDSEASNEPDAEHETISQAGSLSDEEESRISNSEEETPLKSNENTSSRSAEGQSQGGAQNTASKFSKHITFLEALKHIPSRLPSTFDVQESSSITISDDFSHIAKVEERQFLALRTSIEEAPPIPPPVTQNIALQDYQMQLMLLEQQNKKRLMMARQEQDDESRKLAMELVRNTQPSSGLRPGENKLTTQVDPTGSTRKRPRLVSPSDSRFDDDVLGLDLVELQNYIMRLEQRAKVLGASGTSTPKPAYTYRTLYRILGYESSPKPSGDSSGLKRVLSPPFFDPPEWIGSSRKGTLRCSIPVDNFDLFLEKNKDISFIVYQTYVAPNPTHQGTWSQPDDVPKFKIDESIKPITEELVEAVKVLLTSKEEYASLWDNFKMSKELHAPYLFVYHQRADWSELRASATQPSQEQLTMLWDYIIQNHGDEFAAADACISDGKITSAYIQYLFKPGDILVEKKGGFYLGWLSKAWAKYVETYQTTRGQATDMNATGSQVPLYGTAEASKRMASEKLWVQNWNIWAWHWDYDGNFQRRNNCLSFSIAEEKVLDSQTASKLKATGQESESGLVAIPIQDLRVFPIRFAPPDIAEKLRRRGKTFWKCRFRSFVSYEENAIDGQENTVDERYMIDLKAYRSLHKNNQYDHTGYRMGLADELGPEAMKKEDPPDEKFELLLPATIKGFNMRRKKWFDLVPERVRDVEWNKEAFQKVVMNRKAKDLIQALVSNQLAVEASTHGTDLIEGKGNGLILLLHGSPGTGKTLTAESVAEIAEKPLYRVTCADIGTRAEDAEKYLESILHLGKLWRCVVLLDEADVFLEQRSLEDLERNALVSVFLRILEYYEGILILTSNRVGTFDEAFKSRIQLALHYPALGPYERLQIWQNFLERLEKLNDSSIDTGDLRDHLYDLKEEEMNGRQIRNAITSARQYARWKGETLTYARLKDVIEVAGRFDKYLVKLHKGLTYDQLAEDEGLRLG
ncbi:hypothetical protein O1611_g1743 [Lasiodiplodia mahajangana]|uniref:Uncharacterized protein n=1 Tax=Lasiodiplodia mahajangana TaxID=1108764 RepID=A0ACC2JWU4_9PEZI|nr:hypothetical protein O1611_g1743 [Lasiodiplodia mahajangana]